MTREAFRARHEAEWQELSALLDDLDGLRRPVSMRIDAVAAEPPDVAHLAQRYRTVCRHLALARQRAYGDELTEALHRLALRAHRHLYSRRPSPLAGLGTFFATGFPRAVRREARLVLAAALAFGLPLVLAGLAVARDADRIHLLLTPEGVRTMETMYDPSSPHFGRERASAGDWEMFGLYVWNNVSIAFRIFAGGLFAGVGDVIVLVFNGLVIGGVAGYLTAIGYGRTFFPFVAGHGAFELTALVLVGAAGLRLGLALIAPGQLRRGDALRRAAGTGLPIVYGSAAMLVGAAFVEAFWSSRVVDPGVKYAVAGALWTCTLAYLTLAGRGRAA